MQITMASPYARYTPTQGKQMNQDLIDAVIKRRMATVRKSSMVAAKQRAQLDGLGDFSWAGAAQTLVTGLVGQRMTELNADRASADARLAAAEADARRQAAADAAQSRQIAAETAATRAASIYAPKKTFPLVPVAIGAGFLAVGAFLFMRGKKGKVK